MSIEAVKWGGVYDGSPAALRAGGLRCESSSFHMESSDKAAAQEVREERGEMEVVNVDRDGRAAHCLLQPLPFLPTGLLQAGEGRGLADDG